jgi:hypothetical protein
MYAAGVIALLISLKMMRLRPLLLGCCSKVEGAWIYVFFLFLSVMQQSVGIFVLGC